MSKTNQERLQDNNIELHDLKSQIDNLPEYQDLEPIYDITDITTYQIPYTPVSNNNNGLAYVKNYFSFDKRGAETSLAEHYLGRINQDGTVILFKSRNGYGFIVIVDVIDNYIYYTSTTSSGSYIGNFTIYRINMDSTPYVEENYMTVGNLNSTTWSTDIQFIGPSILGFGSENYIQIDLLNKTYVTRNTNNSSYKISNLVGLDGNRKKVQNMSTGIISPSNYSDIIRFVNVSISKAIVGNHLYSINNDLSQGSLIKENVLSNLNVSLGDYIITNFDGNYYYLFPTRSYSPTTTGYLINFNEDTNEFTIAYTLNKLTISADRKSFLTPYYVSSNGYIQYLTCNADINKLIGYEVYGNKLYLNRLETIQNNNILNNYQVYEKDGTAIIGSMPNNGTLNYTPSSSAQTIPAGYTSGGTISAVDSTIDENIIADNIKKDVEILGVTGTLEEGIDTSDANAIASDIVENKTAYVNGVKLTGTIKNTSYQNEFEATNVGLDAVGQDVGIVYELIPSNDMVIRSTDDACYVYATEDDVATAIGLTADVIKNGEVVLGITGTYEGSGEDLNETITGQENIITNLKALVNRKSEPVYDVADADVYGDTLILSDGQIEKPYTELEYVQSTGTQYIDTNINGSGNLRIKMMFSNWNASMDGFLYGSRTSADLNTFCIYYHGVGNPKYIRCDYDTTTNEAAQVNITNSTGMYYIDKNKNVTTVKDLVLNTTLTNTLTYNNFENNLAIYIFSRNNNGEAQAFTSYYLYYFKIYDNDVLVRDFIPVQRKSDSEVCLYDKVSNTFFINQGTGAFIAGPEI